MEVKVIEHENSEGFAAALQAWYDDNKDRYVIKTHMPCKNYIVVLHILNKETTK